MNDKKEQLRELLKIHYGFSDFRPGQEKAIDAILAGKNTLVIMPTGGGKSLIYQLPALVSDGAVLVVSPLISLMKDQVDALTRVGIPATFINSSLSQAETEKRLAELSVGFYKIVYVAPERFYNREFKTRLQNTKISLFAIDEAHCISQWGHDFRPGYTALHRAIEDLGTPPVVALTATATPEVKEDIIKQLKLRNPEIIITGFARPNLHFGAVQASPREKTEIIAEIATGSSGSGIIYAGTRAKADEILAELLATGVDAVAYHAGLTSEDRREVQENFMSGKAEVVVATNAFGLGIDKRDIRFVIHNDMPGTLEAYYQEAGRAGRDGKKSFCLLLHSGQDRYLQEFFIKGDNPPPEAVLNLYEILLEEEKDTVLFTYSEISKKLGQDMPDMAVGTALKLLEKAGVISRPGEKTANAYFKLNTSIEKMLNAVPPRAKAQIDIAGKLANRYGSEMEAGWEFNAEETAEIIQAKKDTLIKTLRNLAEAGVGEYNPPFKGTQVRILKRISSEEIPLDFEALREKKRRAYDKLEKMQAYIFNKKCRQKFILDYFSDPRAELCGKCDNCLSMSGRSRKYSAPRENKKFRQKENETYEVAPKTGELNTKLTQLDTLELLQQGLSLPEIAKQKNIDEDEVCSHIDFLTKKGLLSQKKADSIFKNKF